MYIHTLLAHRTSMLSLEISPPKTEGGLESLFASLIKLRAHDPAFVSVTCTTRQSPNVALELAARIKRELGIETVLHVTSVGKTRDDVRALLDEAAVSGIENLFVVRGDTPTGYEAPSDGFRYASDLIRFIRETGAPLSLGAACYPEGHLESRSTEEDLRQLKTKVEAGVDFLITQLFFDPQLFLEYRERLSRAGILVPVLPGILPVTSLAQLQRSREWGKATVPERLERALRASVDDPATARRVGLAEIRQTCRVLRSAGVSSVHLFSLNQWQTMDELCAELGKG